MQTLSEIVPVATLATVVLGRAWIQLLRTLCKRRDSQIEQADADDLVLRDYAPLQRMLAPVDFQYLRLRGMGEERIACLRRERRKIFRQGLRSLARDFDRIHCALQMIMARSAYDRKDLAAEVTRQRVAFYRSLILVEYRLTLHALGLERMPEVDLLQPLEILQAQLRQLALERAGI
jgi:hypothetical protein